MANSGDEIAPEYPSSERTDEITPVLDRPSAYNRSTNEEINSNESINDSHSDKSFLYDNNQDSEVSYQEENDSNGQDENDNGTSEIVVRRRADEPNLENEDESIEVVSDTHIQRKRKYNYINRPIGGDRESEMSKRWKAEHISLAELQEKQCCRKKCFQSANEEKLLSSIEEAQETCSHL